MVWLLTTILGVNMFASPFGGTLTECQQWAAQHNESTVDEYSPRYECVEQDEPPEAEYVSTE